MCFARPSHVSSLAADKKRSGLIASGPKYLRDRPVDHDGRIGHPCSVCMLRAARGIRVSLSYLSRSNADLYEIQAK